MVTPSSSRDEWFFGNETKRRAFASFFLSLFFSFYPFPRRIVRVIASLLLLSLFSFSFFYIFNLKLNNIIELIHHHEDHEIAS